MEHANINRNAVRGLTLDVEADCVHLIVREDGRLALGMALCSGSARLGYDCLQRTLSRPGAPIAR